ncbi:PREDICTED: uncharacterized protein LOC106111849 [Papilio polytes]|uniref:uncharacterized protein LOC106111849 n=1 Tax=Papilio polytes TaxID=76194 RepID=UPI00067671CA|nr:PREDICTED: uncharacterized protein LOC106111849 [Papilio polytes]
MLAAYVVANQEKTGGYEKSGYEIEDGDYVDKSNEKDAILSGETRSCDESINIRKNPQSYEHENNYKTRNHKFGYSASSSAAASADASAKAYEHGHKDTAYI